MLARPNKIAKNHELCSYYAESFDRVKETDYSNASDWPTVAGSGLSLVDRAQNAVNTKRTLSGELSTSCSGVRDELSKDVFNVLSNGSFTSYIPMKIGIFKL